MTLTTPKRAQTGTKRLLRKDPEAKLPKKFVERIHECTLGGTDGTTRSNCIGTALFITGETNTDKLIFTYAAPSYLKELVKIAKPVVGCLVTWECGRSVEHMAVVVKLKPLLIADRFGAHGPFRNNVGFDEIDISAYKQRYYLPKALQR
jgi:hypothetical protein